MKRFLTVRAISLLTAIALVLSASVVAQSSKGSAKNPMQSRALNSIAPVGYSIIPDRTRNASLILTKGDNPEAFVYQDFEGATFPPTGWTLEFTGTQYWTRYVGASGYGSGLASAKFDFYNAFPPEIQSVVTPTMTPTVAGDSLKFDHAYATYVNEEDSLILETSVDGGSTYTALDRLGGGVSGPLVTAPPQTAVFAPTAGQWATKRYALPLGTNKIRFTAISAYGNNLFIDNIAIGTGTPPVDIVSVGGVYALGKAPIPYGNPQIIRTLVANVSLSPVTFNLTLTVKNAASTVRFTNTQTVTGLAGGTSQIVSFAGWSPTIAEDDSLIVTTSVIAGEDVTDNNRAFMIQNVNTNRYTYSQGSTVGGGVGLNGVTGDFVARFSAGSAGAIDSIQVNFTVSGQPYQLGVWDATGPGGTPGANLYSSTGLTSAIGAVNIPLGPVPVSGDFFVGIRQIGTTNIGFAFQTETPIRPGTFYYTSPSGGTTWTDFSPGADFRLMIEANIRVALTHDIAVYALREPLNGSTKTPNVPFSPAATFRNFGSAAEGPFNVKYEILNSVPAVVYSNTQSVTIASGDTAQVTFASVSAGLPVGSYTIRAISQLASDANPSNDTLSGTIAVAYTFCDSYSFAPSSGTFTALTGATVLPPSPNTDDGYYNAIPIGFNFTYLSNTYTTVGASTNGWISLTGTADGTLGNDLTTGVPAMRPILAPLWDDLDMAEGTFSYLTAGSPGSRVFTAEWLNVEWNYSNNVSVISFQVKLYEANGRVEFIYRQEANPPANASASIGVTAVATGNGNFLSLDGTGPSPVASCSLETTTLNTQPATGQIYAFFPASLVANDIAALSVNDPASGQSKKVNTAFSPKATFRNAGTSTQTSIPVRFKVFNGASTLVYSNNQTIASLTPFSSQQVTFANFTPTTTGTFTARAIALNPGDLDGSNDSVTVSFFVVDVPQFLVRPDSLIKQVPPGNRDSILFYMRNAGGVTGNFSASAIIYPPTADGPKGEPVIIPMKIAPAVADYQRGLYPPSIGSAPRTGKPSPGYVPEATHSILVAGMGYGIEMGAATPYTASFNFTTPGTLINHGGTFPNFMGAGCFGMGDQSFMYVVDGANLSKLDTTTGVLTIVGPITPVGTESFGGLAVDPTTGTMYASSTNITNSTLYTVNTTTGTATVVGTITGSPGNIDIAINGAGNMYGYDVVNDSFFSIDKTTGAATLIGLLGFDANYGQGFAFDPATGTCYMAAFNNTAFQAELRTVDITTGATTLVGALGTPASTQLGFLAIPGSYVSWLSVAPTSGTIAVGDSTLMKAYFDASDTSISNHPGNYFGRIEVTAAGAPLADILRIPVRMTVGSGSSTVTLGVPITLNWNIVSLPVSAPTPNDSVKNLYVNSVNPYAFAFVGGYVQRFTMSNGPGYWVKCNATYTQNITGTQRDTLTIPVALNWNMIGSISTAIDTFAAHVTPTPANLRASNYFKYASGYVVATTIQPGGGYWVKANGAGSFFMHATGPAAKGVPQVAGTQRSIEELNTLTIRDANGGSQTLYFGADANGEIPVAMFAMPPAPPEGSFDARFASSEGGLMVQTHAEQIENVVDLPITIQSSAYPLTVSWKVTDGSYELSDGSASHPMKGEGTVKITDSRVQQLMLKVTGSSGLPKEFALSQNYPNPFNPTTNIKYALPVDSRVTMDLYNIVGQRVRTLVNDNVAAGYHIAEWDGRGNAGQQLASGVYFLQMSAKGTNGKSFSELRKLMMLK
jgi:hypothetical protein